MMDALYGPKRKTRVRVVDLGKKSFKVRKGLLHKHLGIPEGTKIPEARLREALKSKDADIRHEAASALGLRAMKK